MSAIVFQAGKVKPKQKDIIAMMMSKKGGVFHEGGEAKSLNKEDA